MSSHRTLSCSIVPFSWSQLSAKWIIDSNCRDEIAFQVYAPVDVNTKPYKAVHRQTDGACKHNHTSTVLVPISPETCVNNILWTKYCPCLLIEDFNLTQRNSKEL